MKYREEYPVPKSARAEYENASRLNECGLTEEARDIFLDLLRVNPDHPRLLSSLANTYYSEAEIDRAEGLYLKSIEIAPDFSIPYCNLCMLYSTTGRTDIATEYADKALDFGLKSPGSWRCLGIYYATLGEQETALKYFNAALCLNEEYVIVSYDIGCIHIMLGEIDKGLPYIEKSLSDIRVYRLALTDPDINVVRDLPDFRNMMAKAKLVHKKELETETVIPEERPNNDRFGL
ncbi:MAG: hypothetical protein GY771_15650 [bacterium]|nr:hypothetical protein [bacterium]